MPDIKTKFTLHTEYKDFKPGVSTLKFESLSFIHSDMGCLFHTVFLFLIACVGLLMSCFVITWLATDQLFLHNGHSTQALVTDCRTNHQKNAAAVDLKYTYRVDERDYFGDKRVTDRTCDNFNENTWIEVIYVVSDPSLSRVVEPESPLEDGLLYMMLTAIGLGAFYATYGMYKEIQVYERVRKIFPRLTERSSVLQGEIVSIRGHDHGRNSVHYIVTVHYRFESPHGQSLTGCSEGLRDDLKNTELPPAGTPVTVLYADDKAHMML